MFKTKSKKVKKNFIWDLPKIFHSDLDLRNAERKKILFEKNEEPRLKKKNEREQ